MRIAFYAPFKPLDHPRPSGDLTTAKGLFDFLSRSGHTVFPISGFRARWLTKKPWLWPRALAQVRQAEARARALSPDLIFTYHSYYKAPDLIGPRVSARLSIPYVIFQAAFSTRHRRRPATLAGYLANRRAMERADHVFENRLLDLANAARIVPQKRLTYVRPGIRTRDFPFDEKAREELRRDWEAGGRTVVLTAAMFRPGVKSVGVGLVIRALGLLAAEGLDFLLVLAGDGAGRDRLAAMARKHIPGRFRFLGRVPRESLYRAYSAADLFAFPGLDEALGMVFLEAQAARLPVTAFRTGGIPEVVAHGKTGLLTAPSLVPFARGLARLLLDPDLCQRLGRAGERRVRELHDLDNNYRDMEKVLLGLCGERP